VNGVAATPERQGVHTVLRVPLARVARPVDSGILLTAAAPDKEV
jgi:hypothetical protein